MMQVNTDKCVGCGQCIKDCPVKDIELIEGKARVKNETCLKCGHCIAVCPKNAVTTDEYDMEEVKAYSKDEFEIDSDKLMNFIKFRRSVRRFKNQNIEKEKLEKIIEAGRFTQTGTNAQGVSYTVVTEGIDKLRNMAFESLKKSAENILGNLTQENEKYKRYAQMWLNMHNAFKADAQNDGLFFNAPAVIVVTANSQVDGALASSNMELMADAASLGTFFSGFFVFAANGSKEIKDFIGVKEGKAIVTCMVIGYPNVKYFRTVPRKKADVLWK